MKERLREDNGDVSEEEDKCMASGAKTNFVKRRKNEDKRKRHRDERKHHKHSRNNPGGSGSSNKSKKKRHTEKRHSR